MRGVLVDSNVLLDIATDDPVWGDWSAEQLSLCADQGALIINPIIYAEVSVGFQRIEEVDALLDAEVFLREPLPWEAGFLAGKAFLAYRRRGGNKSSVLPDFYIGAHAAISGFTLLTRDARRYRTAYPKLELISPDAV
ncbi:MAG: type II toxin-antitoxin system VapC family toxin [Mariprofundaceae bacterium]|nr:type II toxin-antitoxin system VapC family toxin [Mariprofundaceae bacterium]